MKVGDSGEAGFIVSPVLVDEGDEGMGEPGFSVSPALVIVGVGIGVSGPYVVGVVLVGLTGCGTGVGLNVFGLGPGKLGVIGVNFLKNCLLRSVIRPDPSTFTRYLLKPRSSNTNPDLSHFFAILPAPY